MEITCFSANVHQCDIVYNRLCMYNCVFKPFFICYYVSFFVDQGSGQLVKRIYASGWFVRIENNKQTPNTNSYV